MSDGTGILLEGANDYLLVLESPDEVGQAIWTFRNYTPEDLGHTYFHKFTAPAEASEDLPRRPIWIDPLKIVAFETWPEDDVFKHEEEF